jgi:hypothetical protein
MLQDNRNLQLALGAAALVPLVWGSFWLSTGRKHRSGAPSVPYSSLGWVLGPKWAKILTALSIVARE